MSTGPRIAFMVTSLSGAGHLVRILALAEAAAAAGARVLVLSGGRALPGIAETALPVVQLPPLMVAGRDFSAMTDADGRPAEPALMAARMASIEAALGTFAPDVLVLETWPFGRRRLGPEFERAIAVARSGAEHRSAGAKRAPRVAVSVRDLPEPPSRVERLSHAAKRITENIDLVLCHGDAGFLPLEASWPLPGSAGARVRHTGYVATPPPEPAGASEDVLLAVGGGDIGNRLIACAMAAAARACRPWRLRIGGKDAALRAAQLAAQAPPMLSVEPAAPDYRARLARAACSVSLAGYNTTTDLAPLTTPMLVVPDETAGEREQVLRAEALSNLPGVTVLKEAALNPDRLATLIEQLASGPRRAPLPLTLDGAERSAALLLALADGELV